MVYHPSIVQARQNLVVKEKQFNDAIADYLPSVNASAGYRKGTSNISTASASNESKGSYSASVSLNQLIYDFGKTPAAIRQAYEDKLSTESLLKSAENNIVYNTRQAYYDLIKQRSLVQVAEETVHQFQVHLEQTQNLFEVGRRIKYDITKAQVDLGNARIDLINARNALTTARAVLNNTLGLAEDPGYTVQEPPSEEFKNYSFVELIKIARQNQPELVAKLAQERSASAAVDQAIADLYPSLSLNGSYGWSGSKFPLVWNWSLGSVLGWNIFSGFQKTNQIDKAVANLRTTRAARAELEQRIYLDITRAVAQLESAGERLTLAKLTVQQAEENLNLVNERYKIGKASSIELTDAHVALMNSRVSHIQATFDYQTAVALIKKTIGGK
jgi:outer membrane protein TolC